MHSQIHHMKEASINNPSFLQLHVESCELCSLKSQQIIFFTSSVISAKLLKNNPTFSDTNRLTMS